MSGTIWWIGAVHVALYALLGTAGAVWICLERIVKWTGNSRVVLLWYVERIRARAQSKDRP